MRKLICLLMPILLVLSVVTSYAQVVPVKVSIQTAQFSWVPSGSSGGAPTEYRLYCGTSSGNYSLAVFTVPSTQTTAYVKDVVKVAGKYYCAVAAANEFGVSGKSNEVFFNAGEAPGIPVLSLGPVLP